MLLIHFMQSVVLTCVGEGPVVHIMPLDLDWKEIPVLTDTSKIIRLSNESLIPAKFTAHMVRPNSVWRVEPSSGEIPPEDQMELTITACLDDCVRLVQLNRFTYFICADCRKYACLTKQVQHNSFNTQGLANQMSGVLLEMYV